MKVSFFHFPRNVYLLALCQIIGSSATSMVFLTGGLIGSEITPLPELATLPASMMFVGLAVSTIPAVLLMKKIGRKKGFLLSAIVTAASMLLATYALTKNDFNLFCFAVFLLGTNGAFVQQYRFAALESVPKQLINGAVSFTLFAGIFAGVIGPEIVKFTKDLYNLPHYAGVFLIYSAIFLVSAGIFLFFRDIKLQENSVHGTERTLKQIIFHPAYMLAVLAGAVGFGTMICIMTATPIYMHKMSHFSLNDTAFVLESHLVAMYLPSLFTGNLITRFGPLKIIIAGIVSFLLTIILAVSTTTLVGYWFALVLLGIGWNFLFITGTVLLPQTYRQSERFKAQGINDFTIVITLMTASFLSGSLLFSSGWINMNLLMIPLLLITLIIFIIGRNHLRIQTSL